MTRDDLRGIIEGISDEQLKRILDIHSSDIGKAKGSSETLKVQLESANNRIAELEASVGEAETLQTKIQELQKSIDDRNAQDAAREKSQKIEARFNSVLGDEKFVNDLTKNALVAEFASALEDSANEGRSDREIFSALTQNRDNIFIPKDGVPSVVSSTPFGGDFTNSEIREIMGLDN